MVELPGAGAVPWAVGVLVAVLALRAVRSRHERAAWWVLAAAAPLLAASWGTAERARPLGAWWPLAAAGAILLLFTALNLLLHRRYANSWAVAGLDTGSGVAVAVALAFAVLLEPLRVAGVPAGEAAWLVAVAATGFVLLAASFTGTLLARAGDDQRLRLVVLAVALLWAADCLVVARELQTGHLLPDGTAGGLRLAAAALVALAATLPEPQVARRLDEDAHAVLLQPASCLLVCLPLVWVDHRTGLPTPAVVAALVAVLLVGVKVTLVLQRVTALNDTRRQALTDDLTGLANRRALTAGLARVEAGRALALTTIDLDRFKEVNDVLGHAAGDALLRTVASRLALHTRPGDLLGRQGGDEFAIVSDGLTAGQAAERARRIAEDVALPVRIGTEEVRVAASVGVAAAPEHATSSEALQRRADAAMYRAKAAGGGVVVYDTTVDEERRDGARLLAELRAAVAAGGLVVHYQPQVAATGTLVGVEALVRWPHPTRGLLAPGAFLPLAAQHGLMGDVTAHVLGDAVARAASWGPLGAVRTAVNVPASCLLDPALVDLVAGLLVEHGVPARALVLEVTETELVRDVAASRRVLGALVELGVGVSIDDYGTGYSSLAQLRDLPASELKLDRSFTARLVDDPRTEPIVRTTVDLARSLGMRLVAEGVEDATTLAALHALGVDVTQGYLHGRPVPADELLALLRGGRTAVPQATPHTAAR